ncbi:hypothetical protein K378_04072 [Streptomyces sp. Amel2xB2]|nr:hypothetical protein K378_04072 [Streptomyces sp. Amel2xB2]
MRVLRPDLTYRVDNVNKGLRMVDQGIWEWSHPEIDKPSFFPTVAMPPLIGSLNGLQDHPAGEGCIPPVPDGHALTEGTQPKAGPSSARQEPLAVRSRG